ncbi:MAG: GH3 auxin-responsive promoter, partial [Chitinophagaceae bacterium]
YKVARSKALKRVEAEVVPVEKIYDWSEKFKKLGGQTKIPRVMKAEDFEAFQDYIHSLS